MQESRLNTEFSVLLSGENGGLQSSRGLDTGASTRTSSMAVPSIPEGMERLSSFPTEDPAPSPFSFPDLQTDDIDDTPGRAPAEETQQIPFNPAMVSGRPESGMLLTRVMCGRFPSCCF
jgi:hypothetical protein